MNFPYSVFPLRSEELVKIKRKALQRKIWYRVLSKIERIQINLTIKIVDRVRSTYLAKVLHAIVKKLIAAMETPVKRLMREVGISLARKTSEIGEKLGCKSARKWAEDWGFIQFLTIIYMNTPVLYK